MFEYIKEAFLNGVSNNDNEFNSNDDSEDTGLSSSSSPSLTIDNDDYNSTTNTSIDKFIPHNGCKIDEIKCCFSYKFFFTHSRRDESIVGLVANRKLTTL